MKVLLLNGSPHKKGCTFVALNEMVKVFEEKGIEAELVQVGNLALPGCIACGFCGRNGRCVRNDIVNELAPKFEAADGLVVGSPVYYGGPNATLTAVLDRLFYSTSFDKSLKVGAAVTSCRRGGNETTFDRLNKYFGISGMPIAGGQYWNGIHGANAEQAMQDEEGLQSMRTLARQMAFLMQSIALGKAQLGLPEKEPHVWTNFIR
ncbi:MAG: flavodoxin family protein [Clostridia bacterium]|nr:flavodoxin family protein [Clostridia bacterium]